ncbi:MAG: hypothetical protein D6707_06550 [Bacteroidetes bacterium]|nr:MAG: hypothetical protein D6707_06550 [Bacteroidota bacterium]
MKVFHHFLWGLKFYPEAVGFIFKNRLAKFFIFPVLLNIVYYFSVGVLISKFTHYIMNYIDMEFIQSVEAEWIKSVLEIGVAIALHILLWMLSIFIGGQVVLAMMSPVLAYLSEKTEQILKGTDYPFNLKQFLKDVLRGIGIALYNLYKEIVYMIVVFIVSFIPVIGFLSPVFGFIISAYFFGFSFVDYVNERKKLSVKQSIKVSDSIKGLVVAHGVLFALMMMIPVIGSTLAGFISIISTVAATLSMLSLPEYEKLVAKR